MKYFLAIIGGGPAGYTAAEIASKAGKDVVIFEQTALGGTCLNVGCIPTKTLLYSAKQYYNATHADKYGVKAEVRLYDRLFSDEAPDANPEGFLASLNKDSLTVLTDAVVEPALAAAPAEFLCQFERTGYFVADRYDHSAEHPVFNRSVGLRDSWAKMNK